MIRRKGSTPKIKSIFDVLEAKGEQTQLDPDVIVDFLFEDGLFFISVQNIGPRPAYDISVHFNEPISGTPAKDKKKVSDIALFKNISFMPPDKEIRTFVDTSEAYFARKEPTKIVTRVLFKNEKGNSFKNIITHNLEIYRDIGYVKIK